jgi:uncharacterized protein YfeS
MIFSSIRAALASFADLPKILKEICCHLEYLRADREARAQERAQERLYHNSHLSWPHGQDFFETDFYFSHIGEKYIRNYSSTDDYEIGREFSEALWNSGRINRYRYPKTVEDFVKTVALYVPPRVWQNEDFMFGLCAGWYQASPPPIERLGYAFAGRLERILSSGHTRLEFFLKIENSLPEQLSFDFSS